MKSDTNILSAFIIELSQGTIFLGLYKHEEEFSDVNDV